MDIITVLDSIGAIVGISALLLAVYSLKVGYDEYDETYIGVLYVLGLLLIFLAIERPIEHELTGASPVVVTGRLVIYTTVAYWEYVIVSNIMIDG